MPGVEESKRTGRDVICKLLAVISIAAFAFFLGVSFITYWGQPFFAKNTGSLVDEAIAHVMGDGYTYDQTPTRQEVILIISDVFCGLRKSGFKKTKDETETIAQALKLEILVGDGGSLRLEDDAKKQDSLVFIGRSLHIYDDVGEEVWPFFSDTVRFDSWARVQIEGLVAQRYLSPSDVKELGDLREDITMSELENLLDRIVESQTRRIDYFKYLQSMIEENPIISLGMTVLSVVANIMTLWGDRSEKS